MGSVKNRAKTTEINLSELKRAGVKEADPRFFNAKR